jgi:hypothetical protein
VWGARVGGEGRGDKDWCSGVGEVVSGRGECDERGSSAIALSKACRRRRNVETNHSLNSSQRGEGTTEGGNWQGPVPTRLIDSRSCESDGGVKAGNREIRGSGRFAGESDERRTAGSGGAVNWAVAGVCLAKRSVSVMCCFWIRRRAFAVVR